jgi:hypothetical protein
MDQEPRHLEERAAVGQLLDRIAAIAQDPRLTVDEGDGALARAGIGVTRVVGDESGLVAQRFDVDATSPSLPRISGSSRGLPSMVIVAPARVWGTV